VDCFTFYCRRPHPYGRVKRLSSAKPLDSRSREADREALDSDTENNLETVNKVECGRKQDPPVFHKASSSRANQTSKWSKFLSVDATSGGSDTCSQLDSVDGDPCPVTANLLPVTVSAVSLYNSPYASPLELHLAISEL